MSVPTRTRKLKGWSRAVQGPLASDSSGVAEGGAFPQRGAGAKFFAERTANCSNVGSAIDL
jgi:hypothetical protein